MTDAFDVAVVGAGPAGSVSSLLLARLGYHVVLLDKSRFPRYKPCAEYMSPGVRAALVNLGLAGAIDSEGPCAVPGMEIVSPLGARLRLRYRAEGASYNAFTLPRATFDHALVSAAESAGVELRESCVVHAPVVESGVVRGVQVSTSGKPIEIRARLTVAADGGRSVLARSLDLTAQTRWPLRMGLVAYYAGSSNLPDGFGQMHVASSGYCGIAPLPQGRINVAMVLRLDALHRSGASATNIFERWIAKSGSAREALGAASRVSPVRGTAPVGSRVRRAWAPGCLLVGDAAGFFDPFTGEGIHRALVGAKIAAGVAHHALQMGDTSATVLSRYTGMRRRAFRKKSAVTSLVQLFVQYPRLMEYALPRLEQRDLPLTTLGLVLGDIADAGEFLTPSMLWSALHP